MATASSTLTHPHLLTLLADAEATRAEAERLRADLSDAQLTWRPAPDVWSVADCFEHLRKTDKAYCKILPDAVRRMETDGTAPYRPSWFGRMFIHMVSPNPRLRLKAPRMVQPGIDGSADALEQFLTQQHDLIDLIRQADGKNINTGRFSSPLAGIIKFTVGEALTMLVGHEQRHLGQALRLTEQAAFPSA